MVELEVKLQSEISKRIWNNYLKQVNRIIKPLTNEQKNEILMELQSHMYESMSVDNSTDEESRVLNALERLGDPVMYLQPIVKDKLLYNTLKTLNPVGIVNLFYKNLLSGSKRLLLSVFIGLGYVVSTVLFITGISKIFFYNTGIYYLGPRWYHFIIGTVKNPNDPHVKELLGVWLIPIGISTSLIIYYGLTRLLNRLNKSL